MEKIKIVFLVHTYGLGGLENMVTNLANRLDSELFDCTILSFSPLDVLQYRVNANCVRVVSVNKEDGNDPGLIYRLFRFFREIGAHIVQTHNWGTAVEGILAARLARVPCVIHAERGTIEQRRRNVLIQRLLWNITSQVLSVSEIHRRKLMDIVKFSGKNITAIVNGVDTDRFYPQPNEKGRIRKILGLQEDCLCIGTVGSLRTVKNQKLLLGACKRMFPEFPKLEIVLTGEGPLKPELALYAEQCGFGEHIHFLGGRTDIPEVLNAFDIFVLPSLSEGMPNALMEAMACGIPVIATQVGGVPEVIEDGRSGLLISSEDEKGLAEALADLLRDPEKRQRLGKEGRQRMVDRFSLGRMVERYRDLYFSLLRREIT